MSLSSREIFSKRLFFLLSWSVWPFSSLAWPAFHHFHSSKKMQLSGLSCFMPLLQFSTLIWKLNGKANIAEKVTITLWGFQFDTDLFLLLITRSSNLPTSTYNRIKWISLFWLLLKQHSCCVTIWVCVNWHFLKQGAEKEKASETSLVKPSVV